MSGSRGYWKIGNKERNEVDEVQITSDHHPSEVVRQEYYVLAGIEPSLKNLPWLEDIPPEEREKILFGE